MKGRKYTKTFAKIQVRKIFRIRAIGRKCFTQIYRDLYKNAMLIPTWMGTNMVDRNQQKHLSPSFATKAWIYSSSSLRKKPTFGDATIGFPSKWRLRNQRSNSILMTRRYPDLGSASAWLNQVSHAARLIRSTTQISVVTRHQYGISALVSQTPFGGKSSGSVAQCRLFSQAIPQGTHKQ